MLNSPNGYFSRTILVTGGTGSIGSAIVRKLLECRPDVVRIYSRDETRQHELAEELCTDHISKNPANAEIERAIIIHKDYIANETLSDHIYVNNPAAGRLRFLIGDVRDRDRLCRAMHGIQFVFHVAALKHVPACEYNPFEAVKTNVAGTQNVIDCALEAGVSRVLLVSTDKAVDPVSVMGATKLLAEKMFTSANNWSEGTVFACARFGNVLNSRGSLIPTVERQIERGGPVTITDRRMTRYFTSIERVVELCLKAMLEAQPGEIWVPDMECERVLDVVSGVVLRSGKTVEIIETGIRPGEKLDEAVMTAEERARSVHSKEGYTVIRPLRSRT